MRHQETSRSGNPVFGLGKRRDFATIKLLLKRGTDPRASDLRGRTLLHWAAASDNIKAAKLLIKVGADVSASGKEQRITPLHYARSAKMARLILNAGADLFALDFGRRSPLGSAVSWCRLPVIKVLLQAGADMISKQGIHPCLYDPMRFDRVSMVVKLMELGADPWQGATIEEMPWQKATESCRRAAITYLSQTTHSDHAIHDDTPREHVRRLILRNMHPGGGVMTEDNLFTIAKLIDEELGTRYPSRSLQNAPTSQTLCGTTLAQTNRRIQSPLHTINEIPDSRPLVFIWADKEMQSAYHRQSDMSWLLAVISIFITALFNNSNNRFQGGIQLMKRRRPPCLSMPWTIWPALVVLWGVCWMFIPSPEDLSWLRSNGNDGSTFESNNLGFWNEVSAGQLSLLEPAISSGSQGIGTEDVFPSMLSTGALPDVSAQAPEFTSSDWGSHSAAPQATGQPQGSSDGPQLVQIAPRLPGMTPGVGAMAAISSGEAQRQKSFQCDSCLSKFGRRSTLQRHHREKHGSTGKEYFCPRPGCKHSVNGKGFIRKEWLDRHRRDTKCGQLNSASTRATMLLVGCATGQRQQQASDQDVISTQSAALSSSSLGLGSTASEPSDDANAYTEGLLRRKLAKLEAKEKKCDDEERVMVAEFAARRKRISDEKKQAQAALEALHARNRSLS